MDKSVIASAQLQRRAVLVLSSNPWTAQLVRTLLIGLGVRDVVLAYGPKEALERLASPVDLLIADTGPTTIDGLDVVEHLRGASDSRLARLPVLVLSAARATEMSERAAAAGVMGVVPKPIVAAELYAKVLKAFPDAASGGATLEREVHVSGKVLARRPVLIVSSNRFSCQLLRTLLFGAGATDLVIAETLEAAEARLEESRFDLVVADSGPASIDGLRAVERLRAHGPRQARETPVILLAVKPSADFVARAQDAQVTFIVAKPFTGRVFLNRVLKAMDEAYGETPPPRPSVDATNTWTVA